MARSKKFEHLEILENTLYKVEEEQEKAYKELIDPVDMELKKLHEEQEQLKEYMENVRLGRIKKDIDHFDKMEREKELLDLIQNKKQEKLKQYEKYKLKTAYIHEYYFEEMHPQAREEFNNYMLDQQRKLFNCFMGALNVYNEMKDLDNRYIQAVKGYRCKKADYIDFNQIYGYFTQVFNRFGFKNGMYYNSSQTAEKQIFEFNTIEEYQEYINNLYNL